MKTKLKKLITPFAKPFFLMLGETFAYISKKSGAIGATLLFKGQWRFEEPEWFDKRISQLSPHKWGTNVDHVAYANVLNVLPNGGKILDLCTGNAFVPYYVYSKRASEVVCIDKDYDAAKNALRLYRKPNIKYLYKDILNFKWQKNYFDVIVMRSAIEHFTRDQQHKIFKKAYDLLKPGGYFCGDTPAAHQGGEKMLSSHEYEWQDEAQMKKELSFIFENTDTKTFIRKEPIDGITLRNTLLWACKK